MPRNSTGKSLAFALALIVGIAPLPSWASEVMQVAKDGRGITISADDAHPWLQGERVCVTHEGQKSCGSVLKVRPKWAVVKLDEPNQSLASGDAAEHDEGKVATADETSFEGDATGTDASAPVLKGARRFGRLADDGDMRYQRFGFVAGSNLADASASPTPSTPYEIRLGGIGGFVYVMKLMRDFYLQTEFEYIEKGPDVTGGKLKLDYIEVPFLFKWKFPIGVFQPCVFAGPSVGYLINAKEDSSTTSELNVKQYLRPFDIGFEGGGGVEYNVDDKVSLFLTARYMRGFVNILGSSIPGSFYNTGIGFTVGILFDLGFVDDGSF